VSMVEMQWACDRTRGVLAPGRAWNKGPETPACPKRSPPGDEGAGRGREGYPDTRLSGDNRCHASRPVSGNEAVPAWSTAPPLLIPSGGRTDLSRTG